MLKYIAVGLVNKNSVPNAQATPDTMTNVMNIVLAVLGALAFLMIVVAGFRYIVSEGEPEKIAEAKRMIIYSLVGLLIVALAATIVNFVINST